MVEVIKKFTQPARFMDTHSKTMGLERTDNETALTVPFCTAAFKGQVLQLLLTNAVPGFVLKEVFFLPTTKTTKSTKDTGC